MRKRLHLGHTAIDGGDEIRATDEVCDHAALQEKKPEIMKFMFKVGPEMAGTIGMQPYDPKTNDGFGCYGCHQSE